MTSICTNRDLYRAVAALVARHRDTSPPLDRYLRSLRAQLAALADRPAIDPDTFVHALTIAFGAPDPLPAADPLPAFTQVDSVLDRQLDDLRAMAARGTTEDDQRYFGVDAPGGGRWYNFDPLTYLECGIQGAFGGYGDGDDPEDVETIEAITWSDVERFLFCGQAYE